MPVVALGNSKYEPIHSLSRKSLSSLTGLFRVPMTETHR